MIYLLVGSFAAIMLAQYRSSIVPMALSTESVGPDAKEQRPAESMRRRVASAVALSVSFSVLFGVAALRRGPGTDYWARYVPLFQDVSQGRTVQTDPGFLYICRAIAYLTHDYQWLFVFMAFATVGLVYRAVVRLSVDPALSIYIYAAGGFFLESFNLMRQWLAIAILMNTIECLVGRKPLRFLALTVIAVAIHASSLIWILVWPMRWVRVNWRVRTVAMVACVVVVSQVPMLLRQGAEMVAPSYAWYFDSNYGEARVFDPYGVCLAVVVLAISTYTLRGWRGGELYRECLMNIQAMQIVFLAATLMLTYAFSRLTYYFTPIQMFIVPLALSAIRRPLPRRIATFAVLVAYAVGFYFKFIVWNSHGVMPYESIFGS